MNFLLDTHVLIWFINGDEKLSNKAKILIEDRKNKKYVSIATIWELSIKISINKINFKNGFKEFLKLVDINEIEILPISIKSLVILTNLDLIHKDPFDRVIIAQCISENHILITKDEHIPKYPIKTIW
jgi:PIN domain nuclease of toxin-antitoxin system